MRCPHCGSSKDQVVDSRPLEHSASIRRRRECLSCRKRFTTYEKLEDVPLVVVKSDRRREPFNREKLREGVERACGKRPVSADTIERILSEVEYEFQDALGEVTTKMIGDKILDKLWDVDLVAYIRFASVYRQFGDIDTFIAELKKLKQAHRRRQQHPAEKKSPQVHRQEARNGYVSDPRRVV